MAKVEAFEFLNPAARTDLSENLVSILIPAYNHQSYIETCLNSIALSKYGNLEIVIIDDGSTDSTFQVIRRWAHVHKNDFVRLYIESQINIGLTRTLNKLISLARGEYITLLASDDAIAENSITERVGLLKKNRDKKVVVGNCHVFDEDNNVVSSNGIKYLHNGSLSALMDARKTRGELILNWSVPGPVMLAHRSVYDDKLCYEKYNPNLTVEDRYWYLEILSKNDLIFLNRPVAYYRIHATNTSAGPENNRRMLEDILYSEKQMLLRFCGKYRIMLYLSYLRNFYLLKTYDNPSSLNKFLLILSKIFCKIAIFVNRNA